MKTILLVFPFLLFSIISFTTSEKQEKLIKKSLSKNMSYVPAGNVYVNDSLKSVQSFYISKTEVSNAEYKLFLNDLKLTGELEKLAIAQIDSLKWNLGTSTNMAYVEYYFSHPAYKDYPVVNVSYDAALLYCDWLSNKLNKQFGSTKLKFRLPTKEEFVRAGRGDNRTVGYAWGTNNLRNRSGQFMCNHLQLGAESIHRNTITGKYEIIPVFDDFAAGGSDVTAPVKSYWANQFDVYNMNGNVAEMLAIKGIALGGAWRNTGYDVRLESETAYTEAAATIGFRVITSWVE
jgi:formylglycine-generating enzyme required for sulfatase activity